MLRLVHGKTRTARGVLQTRLQPQQGCYAALQALGWGVEVVPVLTKKFIETGQGFGAVGQAVQLAGGVDGIGHGPEVLAPRGEDFRSHVAHGVPVRAFGGVERSAFFHFIPQRLELRGKTDVFPAGSVFRQDRLPRFNKVLYHNAPTRPPAQDTAAASACRNCSKVIALTLNRAGREQPGKQEKIQSIAVNDYRYLY